MYVCVNDKTVLENNGNFLFCSKCKKKYPKISGVPIFIDQLGNEEKRQKTIYTKITNTLNAADTFSTPILLNHYARKKYLDILCIQEDMKILDLGCQDGIHLRYFKDKNPNLKNSNMYGIDITMSGLLIGKENDDFNYSQGSVYNLPFKEGYFDVVIINGIIEHLKVPSKALKEISRVTKKKGQFVTYFVVKDYGFSAHYLANDVFKNKKSIYASTKAIGHDYDLIVKNLHEYKKFFDAASFEILKDERTNMLILPIIDSILIKIYRLKGKSTPNKNREQEAQMVTKDNSSLKGSALSAAKLLMHLGVKVSYYLFSLEKVVFGKKCGVSYLAYGKKK